MDKTKAMGFKQKDLAGIPWMVAFALRSDGWYLRSDIIWAKNACMPEPVKDRPTKAHEYIFLFSHPDSDGRYFYDQEAIREPLATATVTDKRWGDTELEARKRMRNRGGRTDGYTSVAGAPVANPNGRNKRSWWNINPKPYPGAHFAVWPPDLVEPMIKAGTSEHGVCSSCGVPWERLIEKGAVVSKGGSASGSRATNMDRVSPLRPMDTPSNAYNTGNMIQREHLTVGWASRCDCGVDPIRATVLDPFSGSATTGMVALGAGRDYIGIDLNEDYLNLAQDRILGRSASRPQEEDEHGDSVLDMFGEEE